MDKIIYLCSKSTVVTVDRHRLSCGPLGPS
jgi:hypothetical protein